MRGLAVALVLLAGVLGRAETRREAIDPVPAGVLRLRPTFASCSVCWGATSAERDLVVTCRKAGSADAWTRAPRFPFFEETGDFRGSLLDLQEDTSYEMRVSTAGGKVLANASFRTWASDVPVARTVVLDPRTAKFPIRITENGTADGWIRYTLPPGTALTNAAQKTHTFVVERSSYVVFDDMRLVGGHYAFHLTSNRAVRVRNCDISGWGRVGIVRYDALGRAYEDGVVRGYGINQDSAIRIGTGCQETVVERCYVHDPRSKANSWFYSHPAGPEAVVMAGPDHSTVLRWNDFVGGHEHRFNDAVEGGGNFSEKGGFNRDADVYGNFMAHCNDDCIELDGGQQNVRCFDNRFEGALCGVSIQGCMVSPSYLFRNAFTGLVDEFGKTGQTIKTDTDNGRDAVAYVWRNEIRGEGGGLQMRSTLAVDAWENVMYDSFRIGAASGGAPGSAVSDNVTMGSSAGLPLDSTFPARPAPFALSRTKFSGVRVRDGAVRPLDAPGTIDVGAAVFRYASPRPSTVTRPFVCSVPSSVSTNAVSVYDLRGDLTLAAGLSTGPLPFAKTGPGRMILDAGGTTATFGFGTGQPDTRFPTPKGYSSRFVLPTDGTAPTEGFSFFSLLDGAMVVRRGDVTVAQTGAYCLLGGYTADRGEEERDVSLVVDGGSFAASTTFYVGERHGFADFNTPRGPARAWLAVTNGTFTMSGGKGFYLGARDNPPTGLVYNSDLRLEVGEKGVFTHGTSMASFRIPQRRGQPALLRVAGGLFHDYVVQAGNSAAADDKTAAVRIEVTDGGVFRCETFSNNVAGVTRPPPVDISVTNGGQLFVDDLANVGTGTLRLHVDGGTVGAFARSDRIPGSRKTVIGPNMTEVTVGARGMTLDARGTDTSGGPLTVVVGSAIASGVAEGADGGLTILADAANAVVFERPCTYTGPTRIAGGHVTVPQGMEVAIDVPAGQTNTFDGVLLGEGRVVKTGGGELRFDTPLAADVLEVREGCVVLNQPNNPVRRVRLGRGSVRLGVSQALAESEVEWFDPKAAGESGACFDLNGFSNTTAAFRSVRPDDDDALFWVKNDHPSLGTLTLGGPAERPNVAWIGIGENVKLVLRKVSSCQQVLSNLVLRTSGGSAFTGGGTGFTIAGRVRFPNVTQLTFNNGGNTTFDFSDAAAFPSLTRMTVDSHTVVLNPSALAALRRRRNSLSLYTNTYSKFVLPEDGRLVVAAWMERAVSPSTNNVAGVYSPADYKRIGASSRTLTPASATLECLSSGPGAVVLPGSRMVLFVR